MEISFKCPECGETVEEDIENAAYDPSEEKVSDGTGFVTTPIACQCGEEYEAALTAEPQGKTVEITDHPEIEVKFKDDTHSEDEDREGDDDE